MNIYKIDDGATYHVVANSIGGALIVLISIDAYDGWDDIEGLTWEKMDEDSILAIGLDGVVTTGIDYPEGAVQNERGAYEATVRAWASICDKPCVLACSEWP